MEKRQFVASQKDVLWNRDDGIHRQMELKQGKGQGDGNGNGEQVDGNLLSSEQNVVAISDGSSLLHGTIYHDHISAKTQHNVQKTNQMCIKKAMT